MSTNNSFVGRMISEKWRVVRHLGAGGVGAVYEGVQVATNKRCAIKVLHAQHEIKESILERFYQELLILRRLRHPGIVEVYEFGFEEKLGFYLVMEYLEGCSLSDYLFQARGDVPFETIYKWFIQICDAMEYSHQKGVIHRDLKPDHVFFIGGPERLDTIKIIDFGIAKFEMGENPNLTQSGTTLGTPRYLSPEQAMGQSIDHRADIYALSVILFELLTRRSVFTADSSLQYMMHHAYTAAPTISMARKDQAFPPGLETLVASGLAKSAADRPESMIAFRDRLFESLQEVLRTGEFATLPETSNEKNADKHIYQISRQQLSFSIPANKIKIGGKTEAEEESDSFSGLLQEQKTGRFKHRVVKRKGTQSWLHILSSPRHRWVTLGILVLGLLLIVGLTVVWVSPKKTPISLGSTKTKITPRVSQNPKVKATSTAISSTNAIQSSVSTEHTDETTDDAEKPPRSEPPESLSTEDGGTPEIPDARISPQSKDEWLRLIQQKLDKQEREKKKTQLWLQRIQEKLKQQEKTKEPEKKPSLPRENGTATKKTK